MKKNFTFCSLSFQKRLLGLLFLFLLCNNAFSQTLCRPVSQTNSEGGLLCVGLNVDSPANAYDSAGLTTFATLTNAVGVGCFVEETMTLNQTARAGDQIAIYFGTGNGLLDLGLLSNVSLQGKFSGTNVGSSVPLNSPLLNLNLLNGNTIAVAKFPVTGDTNQIQIQVGGLVSLLVSLRVYDVRLEFAQPTVTNGLTQTVCSGNTISLTATPAAGTTLAWYSSATSTTALATGNNFTTPALTASTTYYIGITRQAGCEGNVRVPVVLNVSNPIAPAINTTGTNICSTGATQSTTLSVLNPVPGTTYSWYAVPTGGTALASGNTYSPTVSLGTTSFYVEASIGSCISPTRTQVNVVSTAVPAAPTVLTQSVTIQSGQNATLSAATSEAGVQLNWYDVATGGTALAVNTTTYTTPILTASKTYYVEAQSSNGNCVSAARVPVTVTVQPAFAGSCLEASSQQTAQNGLCVLCSSTNPNNSVDANAATAARLTVPVGLINGWIQQTLQFINPGKAGDIVDVDLELPGGLADLSLLGAVSLATYNGATYNNDRVSINNPLVTLQLLSGNRFKASVVAGANFDRVEIRLGGLATVLTTVDIYQATYRFKAPAITGDTTICSGQSTTLTAALAVGETVNWYSAATGGSSLASTASFTTPALTVPTTYYVEVTRNGCVNSERNPVQILIDNPIAPTVTTSPTTICSGQTATLTVQAPIAGTTYNWYDAATGGTLLFTGTSFTTPALIANTNYYVEAVIGTCAAPTRTTVSLTVNPLPAVPTFASSNVIIQSGQSATLAVSNPVAGVTYNWYSAATGGTLLASNTTTYTTPILTNNQTYYVEAVTTATGCTNLTRGAVTVTVIASASTCLQASSQITSTDGLLCALCTDTDPNNSVDGDINTYAQLTVPIGVGGYIQQQLIFTNPGQTGDIIDVELEVPGGLLDISALSNISLATYNGVTYNNDRTAINNNLLNIQLLSGNKFKASFTATAPFDRVEVRLGGVATLLSNLYIYQAAYRFPNAVITGAAAPICAGQTASLTAAASGTETFTWYDEPVGGSIVAVNPTAPLTASTTYYLQGTRAGCENSLRQAVTVTVLPIPTDSDILISTPVEATCAGQAVLAPSSSIAGVTFKYYTDQAKTQEIITGTVVAGQPGVTFNKDVTTGALTINGLSSTGTPYNYYISALNGGTCENVNGTLKQVTVNFPSTTVLTVNSTLAGCGSANLVNAITNYDANTTYTFFDASNNVITADAAANITTSGVYSIQAQSNTATCPSVQQSVTVTINALPNLVVTNPTESVSVGSNVTLSAVSTAAISWFDPQGNPIAGPPFTTGVLNTPGVYTYTVVANDGICSTTTTKVINVIDPNSCQSLTERVYANAQTSGSIVTGTVTDGANAVDGDPQTYSTITTGVGLLGVGTTWQNLTWPSTIAKGTPVTIKLGSEYSLLAVGQNLSVIGTIGGVDIGTLQSVSGSLLNLVSGDNTYEFTFVPSNASGPQDYDGIRIQSASIASVAQNTKVFDAHYNRSVPTVTCTPGDIQDIFYGATDLGLPVGAVTAAVGVSDAWNIADNDITTFATMYSGAGVLAASDLTVQFKTPSVVTDTLRIVISKPATLLDVNLLTGFSIQRYLGNVAVGAPIQNTSTLLSLRLLPGNTMAMVLVSSPSESYDRVRIRFGGVAGVLEYLRVHTVERVANTAIIGGDPNNKITVCPGTDVTLQIPEEACSTYLWYDAPTGGNVVATGITYTVPETLTTGVYKYYIQPVRYGCETYARGEVTIEVKASAPQNALNNITLNGGTNTSICSPSGTVTLATGLSGTPVLTNPVYQWYSFNGTTSQLIPGETTSQLVVNGLLPGTYTYYVGVTSDEFCTTAEADRKQITFTILPPSTVNDILVDDLTVCHSVPASLTPTAPTLTNPVFTWYLDANRTQPITNGSVISGVTYTIDAAGVLTAVGLTKAVSPITYYVAVSSLNTCENLAGTLQDAVIIISDPNTPTTTDATQDFCLINAPTVASIQVNESNIVWYNAPTAGTAYASTDVLTSGTYYAAAVDGVTGCESSVRLAVTVTVSDPGTPTTTDTTQDFCLVNAPTVANIQVNTPATGSIVWYSAATGGTALASTTALATGNYYASILDPSTNCESAVRLLVAVTVNDPGTPTTTDTTQEFCLEDAPTVASIQVNAPATGSIVWYSAATGGTPIASTTALATGNYYASILDPATNCESAVRLQVAVTVNDPGTPTTADASQEFCLEDAPTVASIQVNAPATGSIVWYSAATGGTALASTTVLATGNYYASILDPSTNCESAVRLLVAVTVNDPGTPTLVTAGTQNFCLANAPTFASVQFNESNIVWYTALTGGTAIAPATALTSGTYFAAISDPATGCESAVRLSVTINVSDPGTPTLVTAGTQNFCLVNAPTFASVQFNESNIVWYTALTGGTAIAPATALTSGTYFAAISDLATGCESAVRLSVTINVSDPGTPTLVTAGTQNFCLANAPTFASVQFNETNIVWYTALTGGTAIASTTALTSGTYFAAISDPATGCESAVRLSVTISVSDPGTPTLVTAGTQNFCLVNAPTFASVQFNESNIVWYTALTGGTAIASTTALTSGTYFAAISDPATGCESAVRLSVTISVSDPGTPTTTDTTQEFCLEDAPTIASIQVNTPASGSIVWYSAATGGTPIASTTPLATGNYYASILDPATNCESAVRLLVAVTVNDPGTPTTADASQEFCLEDAPTVASIQVNAPATGSIVWYSAAAGGTALASTTALATGNYYASILDPATNCESSVRLLVAVTVNDPGTPTLVTAGTQNFCLANAPTFASVQFNESNIVWYTALTGGTAIAPATALTSGTYFAAISDPVTGCESAVRLSVTINVSDPGTPTLVTAGTQNFCLVNAPTFASVQFNETNIVWYTALTGGTAIAPATALTSGTYFAAISDPATGCESAVRLSVTINVSDPGTPTLVTAGTQNFCLANAPTFASVQFNETNIVWYTALTGGTAIASTTALTSGTYFAAISDPATGCESAVRLSVTISVSDPGTPTLVTAGTQNFCLANAPTFASVQFNESNIVWYTALTGGTAIAPATALTSGTYFAAISDPATGCESAVRLSVTINVSDPGTPTLVTAGTQNFCLANAPTFASVQFNETNIVWYTALTGGTAIAPATALTSGTYFAAISDPATGCESAVRLSVTISVSDPGTPTLVTAGTQNFCLANTPTFASVQFNETNIVWYTALTGGTAIASSTALTSGTYFAAISDPATGCESAVRLSVTINVSDPGTPTLVTAGTQNFCLVNAPTFASVQFNETNIVWYTALTGGTAIAPTAALTSGTYFAAISDPATGCESAVRLSVTVNVSNPVTPTTNAAAQTFCSGTAPTVASIQVNEANVVWYTAPTGGTALASTTVLATGNYYGAIKDPVTGCESNVRLLIAVTVGNTINPTTNNASQTFCSTTNPTIASIQVNESNVSWFSTPTGGTAIAPTTALTSGTYYGSIIDPVSGCESTTRLQVVVTVTDPSATPTTTDTTQDFCSTANPTIANIQVNEANVIWYSTPTGGTAIPASTALTTGTYYGAVASNTNCENPVRLAVAVSVNTPGVITTPNANQTFCLSALPTLANILVNEPNVVWYAAATGGTPLAANTPLTATTYYAAALSNTTNGCESAARLAITITFENDALVQLTTTDDTPCVFQGVTYSIANGKSNYVWSVTNGTITSGGGSNDGSATISWSDVGPGRVEVTYTNNCDETTTKFLNVTVATCSDLTITNVVDNPTPNFGDRVTFTVTVNNVGEGGFINTIVSDLLPSGYNLISASTSIGTYDQSTQLWTIPTLNAGQSVTLTIVAEVLPSGNYQNVATIEISTPLDLDTTNNSAMASVEPICLTVYNEFTPNNDGANDLFRIDCIESYPNNELKVFNRYGALVYSKVHYENDWDGTANVSGVVNRGDMLPTGTYFYVITIGDGTVKKGWLSIMR
ncbi:gliding motility-associated C-terminal domain-containing protein [Flavobacterium endoglycinae]|uniref:Gliding motility-associated C-terminal domain-containing protein n=1 Tax=Flavobacterium endoglycinae TaxID=2816357 RepID=A0ABX7QEQ9_9FLAO|nr:gliding motility-associated C-terminal domain-containing protein [Flavobacterium endoglycinae]QSW89520.1 gliding motility-associated C-terminal domain-containing protein [Flavobacterium endoglycinae]